MKPEQAQAPNGHHHNTSDDIEGQIAHNTSEHTGGSNHGNRSRNNNTDRDYVDNR